MKIWIDGKFHDKADAKISVFDHCVLYGDGIFEGIRVYAGCVFRLSEHIDRLWASARFIKLNIGLTKEEIRDVVLDTVRENGLRDCYVRLVVTRGEGDMGLNPNLCPKATVFCIAAQIQMYPESDYENGLEIITAATQRMSVASFNGRAKSCNYLNNVMAKLEGQLAGVREALMLDHNGFVVEATGDNVFLVKDGDLYTPPCSLGALRGITRDAVMELAEAAGIRVREEPFTRFEVYDADEMFLTGTAAEVIPVIKVDGRPIGDGKPGVVTHMLIEKYRSIVCVEGAMVYETAGATA